MEIETLDELDDHLDSGAPVRGLRLQDLDLTGYEARLAARRDLTGLVVLGGTVPLGVGELLLRRGAIVFPGVADAPVDPWRGLYLPGDLYAGLEHGYAATPDARAYHWSVDARLRSDAYCTLVRAIHDDSVTDELDEFVARRSVVGIMGGHALQRDSSAYAAAALLGHTLAEAGHLVATGGGPGAMEAANLGALCRSRPDVDDALGRLAGVPGFRPDVTSWAQVALSVRADVAGGEPVGPTETLGPSARSLGIPTWFYGHEPPNVFCDAIAKYFSNAIREEGLLARSNAGVVVLEGAAGTVQEVFQAVTPLFYAPEDAVLPPLVLVGRRHWTDRVPVWPAVRALAAGRPMEQAVHLVDALEEVAPLLLPSAPTAPTPLP
ncbi:Rossmann fold nucleotide-binding protein [Terrabacter sp. NPDC000476]|uniref:LOG family protein n=1 Tax=Terrabacter sp. NPDC000476 TaxID=3154258 RepID=UPI003328C8FC